MPPRARKSKPKEEIIVTEANDATVETEEVEVEENDQPKRRGGRKRSELAHAAREFEKFSNVVEILEGRYAKLAERIADVNADLSKARDARDEAKAKLDEALNGVIPPDAE